MAVEGVFYAKNVRSAITIGHVRGVVLLVAAEEKLPVAEYAPAEVKTAVCGNGAARKPQVQVMVQRILRLSTPPPADAADALALAICHARRTGFARLRSRHSSPPLSASIVNGRVGTATVRSSIALPALAPPTRTSPTHTRPTAARGRRR
jgi:hypothetical protein